MASGQFFAYVWKPVSRGRVSPISSRGAVLCTSRVVVMCIDCYGYTVVARPARHLPRLPPSSPPPLFFLHFSVRRCMDSLRAVVNILGWSEKGRMLAHRWGLSCDRIPRADGSSGLVVIPARLLLRSKRTEEVEFDSVEGITSTAWHIGMCVCVSVHVSQLGRIEEREGRRVIACVDEK